MGPKWQLEPIRSYKKKKWNSLNTMNPAKFEFGEIKKFSQSTLTPLTLTMWCCDVPVPFICYSNTIGCYHLIIRLTFRITINLIRKICFMLLDINEQNKNFQNLLCWTKVIKAQIFELFVPCPYSNIYRVFSRNWYKVFTNCSG